MGGLDLAGPSLLSPSTPGGSYEQVAWHEVRYGGLIVFSQTQSHSEISAANFLRL